MYIATSHELRLERARAAIRADSGFGGPQLWLSFYGIPGTVSLAMPPGEALTLAELLTTTVNDWARTHPRAAQ